MSNANEKRKQYRLSFPVDNTDEGHYKVSALFRNSKGERFFTNDDRTIRALVLSVFRPKIIRLEGSALSTFINEDNADIDEAVEAMFELARLCIDGSRNHSDLECDCGTAAARANLIDNLDSFTGCLPGILRQPVLVCSSGKWRNDDHTTYDNNELREVELAAPICVLEHDERARDLVMETILTARNNALSITDRDNQRRYARWFMGHLVGGSLLFIDHKHGGKKKYDRLDNPSFNPSRAFITDFMIGPLDYVWWYDDLSMSVWMMDIGDVYEDGVEDLLDPGNALAFEELEQSSRVNVGFALATRPSSIGLAAALSKLPNMKNRVENWLNEYRNVGIHGLVFETWDVLDHDWDKDTMFNIIRTKPSTLVRYSDIPTVYTQAAVNVLDGSHVDPDKVVEIFRSIVPDPIHGSPEMTMLRRMTKRKADVKYSLWSILYAIGIFVLNRFQGFEYMEALAWLVNLYAHLLDRSSVDGEDYVCPQLTVDMLPQAVDLYDRGMPWSFIIETLMALIAARNDDELYYYDTIIIENEDNDESIFPIKDPENHLGETYTLVSNTTEQSKRHRS